MQGGRPFGLIARPAAAVELARVAVLVELEHVGHRAVEKGPVVRDDDHAAAAVGCTNDSSRRRPSKSRSLVGSSSRVRSKRDRTTTARARRASCPPERVATSRSAELGSEADVVQGGGQAGIEVTGRQRLVAGQGHGVAVVVDGSTSTEVWPPRRPVRLRRRPPLSVD